MSQTVPPTLILASASPRRRALLTQLGLTFSCEPANIDESPRPEEKPAIHVSRVAWEKAAAVREGRRCPAGLRTEGSEREPLVLGADTIVCVDDDILGKPTDAAEAADMLSRLSGRWHRVITGVALLGRKAHNIAIATSVRFRVVTRADARAYWASGEPRDKAGGYAIQGRGALFVERIEGSYSNVVGLPLFETGELLAREGIDPLGLPLLEKHP